MTTWNLTGSERLVLLCNGDTCSERGADAVTLELRRALRAAGLDPRVHTARTRCLGRCDDGCTVTVQPDQVWYRNVTPEVARAIVASHLLDGVPVRSHVSFRPGEHGLVQESGTRPGVDKPVG
ncbi:MAG: (2Fe-2S) ferredoxin domain-containing protein [Gemmatimonadaceae bacterium]|jgi:(2Fe-2S) ferredoxin|nr:(2Fe-2S) ferredoxin domain-containing protein [Gemmatimonadaceae bacterium]